MAWDSSRPVPWVRLAREWIVYVVIMAAVFVVFFRDQGFVGILAGLLASGPLYLAIGYVIAKLGYQRRPLRTSGGTQRAAQDDAGEVADAPRPKPAPTKRTGGGTRPNRAGKRRR